MRASSTGVQQTWRTERSGNRPYVVGKVGCGDEKLKEKLVSRNCLPKAAKENVRVKEPPSTSLAWPDNHHHGQRLNANFTINNDTIERRSVDLAASYVLLTIFHVACPSWVAEQAVEVLARRFLRQFTLSSSFCSNERRFLSGSTSSWLSG